MRRYKKSLPLKALTKNLDRAGYFLLISETADSSVSRTKAYLELPRASLVFTIGAFDAYLSEITADVMVASLKSGASAVTDSARARNSLQAIVKTLPTLTLEIALMTDEERREAFVRAAIVDHFHTNVANHSKKAVNSTIEIVDPQRNIRGFWDGVEADSRYAAMLQSLRTRIQRDKSARTAGRTTSPPREFPSKMTAGNLLDYWTERRHVIVHQGTNPSVWRHEAGCCRDLISLLGNKIDRLAQL